MESEIESEHRRSSNRASKAKKRALESEMELEHRRSSDRANKAKKRAWGHPDMSIDNVIDCFIAKTRQGPDYVCTCCHRLMYKQTVVLLNQKKYVKVDQSTLADVFSANLKYITFDGNVYICKTCDGALSRGRMPLQAKANGLLLSPIPPVLSCLNPLELRLVSLRIPFMKMVALPSGKQRCIHGPAVNVPSKLDSVCTVLPRLPSQTELIPLKCSNVN